MVRERVIVGAMISPAHQQLLSAALAHYHAGRLEEACALMRQAAAAEPHSPQAHGNLGLLLHESGNLEDAVVEFETALRLDSTYADAHYNLGNTRHLQGRRDEAIAAYRAALTFDPSIAEAHNNLGGTLQERGDLDAAFEAFSTALRLRPDCAAIYHANLGNVLWEQARLDEAIEHYRRSIAIDPANAANHSNLVHALLFHPADDPALAAGEASAWNTHHAEPLRNFRRPHANDRSPNRRLRIGYVSPNFFDHVVGRNALPLLLAHDREQVEVVCYSDARRADAITTRLRDAAVHWRDTTRLPAVQLAELIRADGIDILVDLTLHMAGNRLPVFALKPAPVQLSFAGYPGDTGNAAIDGHLSDPHLRGDDARAVPLADCFWCYHPLEETPAVNPLPALTSGTITFGCLNKFAKVNDQMLALWARILDEVPGSRLLLLCPDGSCRRRISDQRIEFIDRQDRPTYLATHHRIDVMLDTFPYNGHTTTCDALWMGVPVVTLAGRTTVSRGGQSILSNVGLPELVAHHEDAYVQISTQLTADLSRLAALRGSLRQQMQASPLMNIALFARNVEAAYRTMWQRWCMQTP